MSPRFVIFYLESGDQSVWYGTADTLETAKLRVKTFMAVKPADYVIWDQQTGQKMRIGPDGSITPFIG